MTIGGPAVRPEITLIKKKRPEPGHVEAQGLVLWGEPMTPATKKIMRQITRTQKTVAAWCRRKFFVPLMFAYATHDAHGTMQ